jgi:hypothetical protein
MPQSNRNNDREPRKPASLAAGRFSFSSVRCIWIAAPSGAVLAALLIIALSRTDEAQIKLKASSGKEAVSNSNHVRPRDRLESVRNIDAGASSNAKDSALNEREKIIEARSLAERNFEIDHPLLGATRDHLRRASISWQDKYLDLIKRHKSFYDSNKDHIRKMHALNKELSQALTVLDMTVSETQIGPGTLGEIARDATVLKEDAKWKHRNA